MEPNHLILNSLNGIISHLQLLVALFKGMHFVLEKQNPYLTLSFFMSSRYFIKLDDTS
jgi:hypothetical protein